MIVIRRALIIVLSLVTLVGLMQRHLIGYAKAEDSIAALLTKPPLMPDMAIGSAKAPVTIIEYASMTCPHCAAFEENVFPMVRSKYIDTGKVRFVFREFPLDIQAAAASRLARCIANGDAEKYFAAVDTLFKQQYLPDARLDNIKKQLAGQAGMDEKIVDACMKDQAQLDQLAADQKFAFDTLKVNSTPTFFVNGEMLKGSMSFEELDAKIKPHLK